MTKTEFLNHGVKIMSMIQVVESRLKKGNYPLEDMQIDYAKFAQLMDRLPSLQAEAQKLSSTSRVSTEFLIKMENTFNNLFGAICAERLVNMAKAAGNKRLVNALGG